jgi:hypothetical protein
VRQAIVATAAALLTAVAGCGGSGTPTPTDSSGSPTPTPAATLPSHTGLVGAIDSARRAALCENVRLFATTVDGGLSAAADQAFAATLQTLRQAPHDPGLLALAARWQALRARDGDRKTAKRLTRFCAKA